MGMDERYRRPAGFIAYGVAAWVVAGLLSAASDQVAVIPVLLFLIGLVCIGWGVGTLRRD